MGFFAVVVVVLAALVTAAPAAAQAEPRPFGHACTAQNGVRFCPTRTDEERVPSFAESPIPLDVDVTLPPTGDGPFPTIVMLHGYGGTKEDFETIDAEGRDEPGETLGEATLFHYNNIWFAQRGYAVVTPTARGFNSDTRLPNSCGDFEADPDPACAPGFIRLADQRYEVRDTQHLLGLLVDQGIARPGALGVTGISYGGGQSMMLAKLRDRIRRVDGSFEPWRSPNGTPLSISAAYPKWLWSDLVYSLLPNGRYLDFRLPPETYSRNPIGVPIQSYLAGLFALGETEGYYAPPGVAPDADIRRWYARINAGEPYGPDAEQIADEIFRHHQAFGLEGTPPPLLLQSGWTDDLFPIHESLRMYNQVRATDPNARVALQFGDLGHARGSNKTNTDRYFNDQGSAFFDRWLTGDDGAAAPAPGQVTTFTQTCPQAAPGGGPNIATSWAAAQAGTVRFAAPPPQTVTSAGGDPNESRQLDPIASPNACTRIDADDDPGTASYRLPASEGFTLHGRPTVRARIDTTGNFGQLDAHLLDVAPDGQATLVTRGTYRLLNGQDGEIVFQLSGNGYRFEKGHVPKLELLGRDAPYLRPSNAPFSVRVSDLSLALPTLERAGAAGGQVGGGSGGRAVPRLRARVTPKRDLRGPRRFTTSGRLVLPPGTDRAAACRGRVSVQVKTADRITLSTRRARVRPSCRFRSRVTFSLPGRLRSPRLQFVVRFQGNSVLRPVRTRPMAVRVRRR